MAFEHTAAGPLTRWPVSVTCGHWTVGRPGGGKSAMNSHSKEGFGCKSLLKGPFLQPSLKVVITGERAFALVHMADFPTAPTHLKCQ